jgi:N-acetylmuramoyl-L-alanine amidase
MKIALSVGHSQKVRGMRGSPVPPECDEVDECLKICTDVSTLLQAQGVECPMFFDTTSTSQSQYLANINNWTNQQNADLAVSCHLNAGGGDGPVGCEVWYYTQKELAAKISAAMADALGLPDRSSKYSSSLSFLVNTNPPAVLLECFFGDSTTDCAAYRAHYAALVEAIAESMAGIEIDDTEPQPEPPEPEAPPSGDNRVVIDSMIRGDVTIYANGALIVGHAGCEHVVDLQIRGVGDVILEINGEEFHNTPPAAGGLQPNHCEIETTVFGGIADGENSAYKPYEFLNDTELYVALPYSFPADLFPDNPPMVRVYHGELSAVGRVADKGPWVIDDEDYVYGNARPMAETCHDEGTPLPEGPNAGAVPSNRAGLDVSPALAEKIGLKGKGLCDWEFVEE